MCLINILYEFVIKETPQTGLLDQVYEVRRYRWDLYWWTLLMCLVLVIFTFDAEMLQSGAWVPGAPCDPPVFPESWLWTSLISTSKVSGEKREKSSLASVISHRIRWISGAVMSRFLGVKTKSLQRDRELRWILSIWADIKAWTDNDSLSNITACMKLRPQTAEFYIPALCKQSFCLSGTVKQE